MKSDDEILAEECDALAERRARERANPSTITIGQIIDKRPILHPKLTDEQRAAKERAADDLRRKSNAHAYTKALVELRGLRYASCSLGTFATNNIGEMEMAVFKLREYCEDIKRHAFDGTGLFIFGPCGTGKDHLAMGVAKCFIQACSQKCEWASGAMLFEKLRDSFDGRQTEGEVMRPYLHAPLLWISDPLPVRGELTAYQSEALYRLVDARYNAKRPVIVTANIAPGEADKLLGPAIARRLRESTIQIHCNWKAYGR